MPPPTFLMGAGGNGMFCYSICYFLMYSNAPRSDEVSMFVDNNLNNVSRISLFYLLQICPNFPTTHRELSRRSSIKGQSSAVTPQTTIQV